MNISSPSSPEVALIAGPTASGKSALALDHARRVCGTIVNADSAQVYRDLRLVSARPAAEEKAQAPHVLYGYRDGAAPCSAADWADDARRAIWTAVDEGRRPVVVGGTGLYIRTLLDGIAPIPAIEPAIREHVRGLDVAAAHAALSAEDPDAAARLRPSDTTRVARALEVVRSTGKPLSAWQQDRVGGIGKHIALKPLILLPPRDWLYERCDRRFEHMMSDQGLAEVSSLVARGRHRMLPVRRARGGREVAAFRRGETSREQGLEAGGGAPRQYAKRQYTWFAHQSPAEWPRFTVPLTEATHIQALALLAG